MPNVAKVIFPVAMSFFVKAVSSIFSSADRLPDLGGWRAIPAASHTPSLDDRLESEHFGFLARLVA